MAVMARAEQANRRDSVRQIGGRALGLRSAVAVAVLLAAAVRLALLPEETADFRNFLRPWLTTLEVEGFGAFERGFSDYAPAYLYLLWLVTLIDVDGMLGVKAVSVAFDVALAIAAATLAGGIGCDRKSVLAVFSIVLLLPTVVLNSAAWAQCDAIYAACVVAGLAAVIRGHGAAGMAAIGVGIAFKAQAAFVVPALLVLSARGALPWRAWLWLPAAYVVSAVPAVLAGRPVSEAALVYVSQAGTYPGLTLSAPTVYAWLDLPEWWAVYGIAAGGLMIGGASLAAHRLARLDTLVERLGLCLLFVVLVPFVLPRMHDRYFFAADVLSVVFALTGGRRGWLIAGCINLASLACYLPYLFQFELMPLQASAALMAVALVMLGREVLAPGRMTPAVPARFPTGRLLRFLAVGVASTGLFVGIYAGLRVWLPPVPASALGLLLTMAFNFAANRMWSFRAQRWSVVREIPAYVLIYLLGLAASTLALHVVLTELGRVSAVEEAVAVVGSGLLGTATRFACLSRFVYRNRAPRTSPA